MKKFIIFLFTFVFIIGKTFAGDYEENINYKQLIEKNDLENKEILTKVEDFKIILKNKYNEDSNITITTINKAKIKDKDNLEVIAILKKLIEKKFGN